MKNILTVLNDFGLSEKEAKTYLTLLELGSAKVSEIAKHAGLNRSSTYVVLEILRTWGLVGISSDRQVRRYVAASPETLLQVASASAYKYRRNKENIEVLLPELKALTKGNKRQTLVRVFEGKSGLITAFEDSLTCKEKCMRVASSVGNMTALLPEYFPDYVRRRIKKGIKMRGLHHDDEVAKQFIRTIKTKLDVPILVPKHKYKVPADLAIYDDKIGYMTPMNGGLAILVQNKELAEVMKNIFDMAWEGMR